MTNLIEVGDAVTIKVAKENREWGFNPCPDGTLGTLTSFGEIDYSRVQNFGHRPGIYRNRCWANILLATGETTHLSTCHFELTDQSEHKRRQEARGKEWAAKRADGSIDETDNEDFLRDLPELPYWEGDHVDVINRYYNHVIVRINYGWMNQKCNNGSPMPIYGISDRLGAGWHTVAGERDLTLLRRGNVWKYYHQEPMEFADIKEEANFYNMIGRTKDVRNPANNLYQWTKDEVLAAIRAGIVHGLSVDGGLFGSGPTTRATWFLDEEVGKRVAAATLQGFGLSTVV